MVAVAVVARRITQEQYKDITGENPTVEDVAHLTLNAQHQNTRRRCFFCTLFRQQSASDVGKAKCATLGTRLNCVPFLNRWRGGHDALEVGEWTM